MPFDSGPYNTSLDEHLLKHGKGVAVGFGFLMLYRHSDTPNAVMRGSGLSRKVIALRTIRENEEIFVK